ncbi:Xenotropic and polytropic retrovirus receptor 1 [Vanrija pseudolonga]|uniref:Xenotropic and polytropic retrovirus receptor 1 n=1 Tax=Vanrija pseudolonga TaxID=143232 RepID=A0AAF0Y8Z4_9TREE|nr:Xenotropic and polytropic retrovirus receptor 1 [Vanrija pseudolonga]
MKFGQYLNDNATPEWKRAYIDYRACKKQIKRITARLEQADPEAADAGDSSGDDDHGPSKPKGQRPPSTPGAASVTVGSGAATTSPATGAATPGAAAPDAKPPAAAGDTLSPSTTRSTYHTPASGLSSTGKSPGYGAMGTSPRLASASGGVPLPPAPTHPPPLHLGEPALQSPTAPAAVEPAAASAQRGKLPRRLTGKGAAGAASPGRVNFSPVVHAYPAEVDISEGGDSGRAETSPDDASHADTASTGGETAPLKRTTSSVHRSPGRTKASPRPKRSPSALHAGFSPQFQIVSPRVQPSAGLSTSGVSDAPSGSKSLRSFKLPSPRLQPRTASTFDELYETLAPDEQAFFDLLDHELDKVESFYHARELEAVRKGNELRQQLKELAEHRRVFHREYPQGTRDWEVAMGLAIPASTNQAIERAVESALHFRNPFKHHDGDNDTPASGKSASDTPNGNGHGENGGGRKSRDGDDKAARAAAARQYDPERYQKYKRDLRGAMLEFYRHLELIKNYRILNLTGFRKALKKFEKATKIVCLELYTDDRIAPCSFARGEVIEGLIKETEDLFTEHFEHGDGKRARDRLRRQDENHTHYLSMLRSGIMLGLGLPPAVLAIVKSYDPETRRAIPAWDALLTIYAALYLPVLFAMLFELNLCAFVEARINYEFVMELSRPTLDFRSYLEMPTFFFMTLSYCFFFSFYRVATHNVAPTTWPAAWLVLIVVFFLNPLPIFRRRSRYWFLHVLWRVITPGYSRVEFIAFFIADELNSLVYTIQNVYFLSCVYGNHWPDNAYGVCPSGTSWPYALLGALPPLVRLIQCLKRYHDSGLQIHLVNGGKYCSSILSGCLFIWWRSQGERRAHTSFVVWIIFATVSSIYTSAWDLIVDWSLLRPGYKLLRPDLGYAHPIVYYFAMVTNIIVRFIWVWYIPNTVIHPRLRSWMFALFEMLRRWQWNFFRVETEHLGNADAYRVTREIPLPYRRVDDDGSEDDIAATKKSLARRASTNPIAVKLRKMKHSLVGKDTSGRGPDALPVGARGNFAQREYEARRPGDGDDDRESELSAV